MSESIEAAVKDHTMRKVEDEYPGKMAVAETRGTYSGCKMAAFRGKTPSDVSTLVNEFFAANPGLLVVDIKYTAEPDGHQTAWLLYTAEVDQDYIMAINRYGEEIKRKLAEERAEQLEAEARAEEAAEKEEENRKVLIEKGRKCEEHHRPLLEENRKLKDELKKARKGK